MYIHNMKPWAQVAFVVSLIIFIFMIYIMPTIPQASFGFIIMSIIIFIILIIGKSPTK
jgi:hypothetical protein